MGKGWDGVQAGRWSWMTSKRRRRARQNVQLSGHTPTQPFPIEGKGEGFQDLADILRRQRPAS